MTRTWLLDYIEIPGTVANPWLGFLLNLDSMTDENTTRPSMRAASEANTAGESQVPVRTLVVYDEPEVCPYLEDRVARMPLHFPMEPIDPADSDALLEAGFRRSGRFLYRAHCGSCDACEAIRIDVREFTPNRSQQRAWIRGAKKISTAIGPPTSDGRHIELFNRHRNLRGLNRSGNDIDEAEYRMFLVDTCLDSIEFSYRFDNHLIGVAIADRGQNSLSAVYTFFDPDHASLSPGTYSIMKQIEYCREHGLQYLYLGYFVSGCQHMNYKKKFRPNQRLQQGVWKQSD